MDLKSFTLQLPFIYTTRLEEMTIFRKDLSKTSSKEVIKAIIAESKPCYNYNTFVKECSTINKCDNCSISSQNDNLCQYRHKRSELHWKLSLEELQSKVKEIRNKINSGDEIAIKCESKKNTCSSHKLDRLLAMCKPLKIMLVDFNKIERKTNYNITKMEILNISSDSDDDIIVTERNKKTNIYSHKNNSLSIDRRGPEVNHIIKKINDFKNILSTETLKNCVIMIYNVYLSEIDAYHINKKQRIIHQTWKYVEFSKVPMKACKSVFNIIACCWRSRASYVKLLLEHKQYKKIAEIINKRVHLCKRRCTCCCFLKKTSKADVNIAIQETLKYSSIKEAKFIETALKHQRNTKWQGYPEIINGSHKKNKRRYKQCTQLLQLNNAEGNIEFYELGQKNEVYSKLIINQDKYSSWVTSTVGRPQSHQTFTCTDPENREEQIVTYSNTKNVVPFNTECFLRRPMKLHEKAAKEITLYCPEILSPSLLDNIEHTTSLVGAGMKLSLSSKKPNSKKTRSKTSRPTPPVGRRSKPVDKSASLKQTVPESAPQIESVSRGQKNLEPPKPAIEEINSSETINCLIRDILHRFRNVLLTINADGKVAAALNAPLSSLTTAELNILSQILSHAQSQVDKLGLTPGTCLNPDGSAVIQSNSNNDNASSSDANNSNENSNQMNKAVNSQNKNEGTKNAYLQSFSKIICQKKMDYEKSFRSFLHDTAEPTPKITQVFSLSNIECISLDDPESPIETDDITHEKDNPLSVKTEIVDNPKMLMDICINECKEEIKFMENEIETTESRKRKSSLKSKTEPPKIRVKKNEEVFGDGLRINLPVPPNFVKRSEPSTLNVDSTPNPGNNFRLRNLLLSQPKKIKHLPITPLVRLNSTATFYEVTPHGVITAHTNVPKV